MAWLRFEKSLSNSYSWGWLSEDCLWEEHLKVLKGVGSWWWEWWWSLFLSNDFGHNKLWVCKSSRGLAREIREVGVCSGIVIEMDIVRVSLSELRVSWLSLVTRQCHYRSNNISRDMVQLMKAKDDACSLWITWAILFHFPCHSISKNNYTYNFSQSI